MESLNEFIITNNLQSTPNFMLSENRIAYLKKNSPTYDTDHEYGEHLKDAGEIIDHFANNADPSKKKTNTQWIMKQYANKNIRQEDHPRIKSALEGFEKYKPKLDEKDIGKYKSVSELEDAVEPHLGTAATKAEDVRNIKHEGAEKKYEDDNISVHHIKTKEAAQYYGKGTKWCTAADSDNNMFHHYADNLHVIMDKKNRDEKGNQRKYQFHAASNQFMNEKDDPINKEEFNSIKPSFHKAITEHPSMVGADLL